MAGAVSSVRHLTQDAPWRHEDHQRHSGIMRQGEPLHRHRIMPGPCRTSEPDARSHRSPPIGTFKITSEIHHGVLTLDQPGDGFSPGELPARESAARARGAHDDGLCRTPRRHRARLTSYGGRGMKLTGGSERPAIGRFVQQRPTGPMKGQKDDERTIEIFD